MKKTIRMNERELHRLISESVKRVLKETNYRKTDIEDELGQYFVNCVNGGKAANEYYGETYSEALDNIEKEGLTFIAEISGDVYIYKKDNDYYLLDLEEDDEGGWCSWIVDISHLKHLIKHL